MKKISYKFHFIFFMIPTNINKSFLINVIQDTLKDTQKKSFKNIFLRGLNYYQCPCLSISLMIFAILKFVYTFDT